MAVWGYSVKALMVPAGSGPLVFRLPVAAVLDRLELRAIHLPQVALVREALMVVGEGYQALVALVFGVPVAVAQSASSGALVVFAAHPPSRPLTWERRK